VGSEMCIRDSESMKCYFMPSDKEAYFQSDVFGKVLAFVQQRPRQCKMKEYKTRLILRIDEIRTVDEAIALISQMEG